MIGRVLGDVHNTAKFFNLLNRDIVWNTIDVYRHVLTRDMDEGKHEQVRTETLLDSVVRQLSVYAVAAMGLFLIVKEHFIGKYISKSLNLPHSLKSGAFVKYSIIVNLRTLFLKFSQSVL